MQTVSQSWKDVHKKTLLNESYVEVSLDIADPDALAGATATDNGAAYISDTPEVVSEVDTAVTPYGTLEQNVWLLDGSRKHIPASDYQDGSYIGDVLGNEKGNYSKTPTLTINFKQVHTQVIPGITIIWGTAYNEFATQFVVTAYNGNTVVASKSVMDNTSVTSIVTLDIANYDRITIQVMKWCLPNRRVRIDEVFLGWHKVYSKTDLMSYSHTQSVDPISTALPKMEIQFSIDNSDGSYNPYNLSGLSKYLTERQELSVRYGLKLNDKTVEWIKGGKFYLSEWYAKQNGLSADFVARDLLEFMSDDYIDSNGTNMFNMLAITNTDESIVSAVTNKYIEVTGQGDWIDTGLTLSQLCPGLKVGDVVWIRYYHITDNVEWVEMSSPSDEFATEGHPVTITQELLDDVPAISWDVPDGKTARFAIGIYKSQYILAFVPYFTPRPCTLYELATQVLAKANLPLNSDGTERWLIDDSLDDIEGMFVLPVDTIANCLQMIANAACCVLYVDRDGQIRIERIDDEIFDYEINSFNSYSKPEITLSKPIKQVVVKVYTHTAGDKGIETTTRDRVVVIGSEGETITVDNPIIINDTMAQSVGEWVGGYLKNRMTVSASVRADVRLDALDIVKNIHDYGVDNVRITDVDFKFNGAFRGTVEGRVIKDG